MAEAPETKSELQKPAIRTMRSDIAEFLKSGKSSLVSIFGQGVKKETLPISPRPAFRARWFIGLSAIGLLILSVAAFLIFDRLWSYPAPGSGQNGTPLPTPPFFFENTSILTIANQSSAIRQALERLRTQTDSPGSTRRIVFQIKSGNGMAKTMNAQDFFEILRVNPPPEFLTNLAGPLELFAAWSADGPSLGLLTKTLNSQRTFQGLLKWEAALTGDLEILFWGRAPELSLEAFKDYTYRNIDFRFLALEGDDRGIGYLVFPAKGLVVISTSFEATRQVIQRLLEAR